jgi:hypothetical protein
MTYEHRPAGRRRAFEAQVIGDGASRRLRQRQDVFAPTLGAAQPDGPGTPVDILQRESSDLPAA